MQKDYTSDLTSILSMNNCTPKIDALNSYCYKNRYADPKNVIVAARAAEEISKELKYEIGAFRARMSLAFANFILSNDYPILKELTEVYNFFKKKLSIPDYPILLNYLANVYDNYGDYQKGLSLCHEALNIAREHILKEVEGDILSTNGLILSRISDYSGAIKNYKLSYEIRKHLENAPAMASSLNLLARTYALNNEFDLSEQYYQSAIKLRQELNEKGSLPWSYIGIASLYEKKKDFSNAILYYQKSLELNSEHPDKRCLLHCSIGLSRVFLETDELDKTKIYIEKTIEIAQDLNANPILYEAYEIFSRYYEKINNITEAYANFKKFHELREKVLNAQTHIMLKNQQLSFEIEKVQKDAEIYQLRNIELKNAYSVLEANNNEIINSIDYAKNIQNALLPPLTYFRKLVSESFILYRPKAIVSGDFYWCYSDGLNTYIAAADCTGHGVPGGFMSVLGMSLLNEIANSCKTFGADELLNELRKKVISSLRQTELIDSIKDGMDIALLKIYHEKNILEFAGAFNPLYIVKQSQITEIKADRMPIGIFSEEDQLFNKHIIHIEKGMTVYIFSDGYADQFGGTEGKKLRAKNFKELIIKASLLPINKQESFLEDALDNWMGANDQVDDILVIGINF